MSPKEPNQVRLQWIADQHFEGVGSKGSPVAIDGKGQASASPMDALLTGLCGCMGIDIVMILDKMRVGPVQLGISATGYRPDDPPRYFERIELEITYQGEAQTHQIERAARLSLEKYCSAVHSLRRDTQVSFKIVRPGKTAEKSA